MRKSLTLLALTFSITGAMAQEPAKEGSGELKSKKGEAILPEAGDWSLGIEATPFLNYVGNFFGKTANNNAPTWNFLQSAQTITGKYFKDEKTAYRGSLRIGKGSQTTRSMVADRTIAPASQTVFPNPVSMKENEWKHSSTDIGLAGGIEMRKGKTRLQGYYGGELGIYFSSSKDKFTYGNALTPASSAVPVSADAADAFAGANNYDPAPPIQLAGPGRVTERKNGSMLSFGVRGFIGAEYFVLPKMSIGGEFGWGIGLTSMGKSKTTIESVGGTTPAPGTATIEGAKQGSFALDTDNNNSVWGPTGSLRLNFHF